MQSLLSNKLISQLTKVFWITVAWTIISYYQFLIGLGTLRQFDCIPDESNIYIYQNGSILTGLIAGTLGGSGIVFLFEKWLRNKTYGLALFYIFLTYSLIYLMVDISLGLYFTSYEMGRPFYDLEVQKKVLSNGLRNTDVNNFSFWLIIVMITLIALLVNDKYGPGIFRAFLLGKYFQPKREERIFMFLDLRSSTTIAEKLGEIRYFNFIKNVFKDVTPAILNHKGEIYQYVGDEIVISWQMDNGVENANCIHCFFDVQAYLLERKDYYMAKYDGIYPEFKAGLHYGHVMAGEVGVVKRDIAFSGDVLNTTARIQSKCNELGVNILLSKFLLDKLALQKNVFHPQRLGDILLRGKQQKVMLYTL